MKHFLLAVTATLAAVVTANAQQLTFSNELSTRFDNTEYTGSDCGSSRTLFNAELITSLRYAWDEQNTIVAGAALRKNFGDESDFMNSYEALLYYRLQTAKFGMNAGMFEREHLAGDYSRAFFSDSTRMYHPILQGFDFRYRNGATFAELAIDWEGMYSAHEREKFRILMSAGGEFAKYFNAGVALSLQHYANKSTFEGNVVDNLLVNPYIEARWEAFFNFRVRLGGLISMQRDRKSDEGWKTPAGGELGIRIERWGAFIDNNTYIGKSLMPFYNTVGKDGETYGCGLYAGDPFYGTTHHVYNRTGIGYEHRFFSDALAVRAEMVLQYNGQKLYYQQLIGITVHIAPTLYDKRNHKK